MTFKQTTRFDNFISFEKEGLKLNIVDQDHRNRLARMAEADIAFKKNENVSGLLDYRNKKDPTKDIS